MKAVLTIVAVVLGWTTASGQTPTPVEPNSEQPPQLRILPQPDAPLRIVSANVTWIAPGDRRGVQIYVVVKNVSQQLVRTYATRRGFESTSDPKSCLGPPGLIGLGLRPGQQTGTSTWQGIPESNPAPAVWIDFVELADGTRWGRDECGFAEQVDGERAGDAAQRDQLLHVLREQGVDKLMEFIRISFEDTRKAAERRQRPQFPLPPPAGHSKRWEEGFSRGAARIVAQVVEAERNYGAAEVEHVLLRPIQPSDKKGP